MTGKSRLLKIATNLNTVAVPARRCRPMERRDMDAAQNLLGAAVQISSPPHPPPISRGATANPLLLVAARTASHRPWVRLKRAAAATPLPTGVARTNRPKHPTKGLPGARVRPSLMAAALTESLLRRGRTSRVVTSAPTFRMAAATTVSHQLSGLLERAAAVPLPQKGVVLVEVVHQKVPCMQAAPTCLASPVICRRTTTAAQILR